MLKRLTAVSAFAVLLSTLSYAQSTTADILGTVTDSSGAVVSDANVAVRNLETNAVRETTSGSEGTFRFSLLPSGSYELVVTKQGFAKFVQQPITLRLNQAADIRVALQVSGTTETVSVTADALLINTTNAEVGVNFDTKRISEVPLTPNRNIINLALNIPGVSQLSSGQQAFGSSGQIGAEASNISFSVNGMRVRSNNFMLDGQDSNDPSVTGLSQGVNNPDVVQEFRVITNQFTAEYGRAAGSVVNILTKKGTNSFHGTAFWFHNSNTFNSRNNLDEQLGRTNPQFASAPFRVENQTGGTLGGPLVKDKTFFFVSAQRWWDRRLGTGAAINGVPTEAGRQVLQSIAGSQPTVRALLENLPPAQAPIANLSARINFNGQEGVVPLGVLTGSTGVKFDDWQWSARVDQYFGTKHTLTGRYLFDDGTASGTGQATPPGLTNVVPNRRQSAMAQLTSSLTPTLFNELRFAYSRFASVTNASNPEVAERIPGIEVPELGLIGFNADATRTGIGLAINLPQFRRNNTYQLQNTIGWMAGDHTFKGGIDFRYTDLVSLFLPQIRGSLTYPTLDALVNDVVLSGAINVPLPGGETLFYSRWNDYFAFFQDEWRIHPRLTLSLGLRYEYFGDALSRLQSLNERILNNANNNSAYSFGEFPGADARNWAPRIGFNYRLTDKTVLRGGYSRTYDYQFLNIGLNIFSSFPFVIANNIPAGTRNGFAALQQLKANPTVTNPNLLTRTTVASDFRAPYSEQVSFNVQRSIGSDWAATIGYVGTKGTALFQTVDGNPRTPTVGVASTTRIDPTRGVIRLRANTGSSIYHSLQTSLEKRYSRGLIIGGHYTWSSFIDDGSEVFNAAVAGDVAVAQDSFNRRNERGRSTYDRPHRFSMTAVYELPWLQTQKGLAGKILGGWQVNGFLTFQSGAPFTPLSGIDPGSRLDGIASLVGNAVRPFLNTDLDLSSMTVEELRSYNFTSAQNNTFSPLFRNVTVNEPLGNVGRNVLRSDGIQNLDLGLFKNTRFGENFNAQLRAEAYNVTNTRNFGIPDSRINSANFLNQWARDGGNRRLQLGLRLIF